MRGAQDAAPRRAASFNKRAEAVPEVSNAKLAALAGVFVVAVLAAIGLFLSR
jgi:hypothetical protein